MEKHGGLEIIQSRLQWALLQAPLRPWPQQDAGKHG